jgi:hypothetical protein
MNSKLSSENNKNYDYSFDLFNIVYSFAKAKKYVPESY